MNTEVAELTDHELAVEIDKILFEMGKRLQVTNEDMAEYRCQKCGGSCGGEAGAVKCLWGKS